MRLFLERGYAATPVSDVAAAAGVSSMTVFRHFPTKEALVLADDYDPHIVARIKARPRTAPLMRRILTSLVEGVAELGPDERDLMLSRVRLVRSTPALRARHWETQYQTQQAIVAGLCGERPDPDEEYRVRVSADACLAAAGTAIFRWVDEDGATSLPDLLERALAIVADQEAM